VDQPFPHSTLSHAKLPFLSSQDQAASEQWINALAQAMPNETIVHLQDMSPHERARCDVAIVANPDPALLKQLPNLKWVHSVWAGVDRMLVELGATDLKIVRLVDPQLAQTMAEAVLAWTLYLHRDMPTYLAQQKSGFWHAHDYVEPQDKFVGVMGLGVLGQAAAAKLLQANFKVGGWARAQRQVEGVQSFAGDDGLVQMLEQTDILVCLLPLTPDTTGLLNSARLAHLPTGTSIINFARGAIVVDSDLRAALDTGALKHAVLDVFEHEPLTPDSWHWRHKRVSVLPHCSGPTSRHTASAIVAQNISRFRADGTLPATVDLKRGY
jgi:glyoxylate/hydroxypyruvate reductase